MTSNIKSDKENPRNVKKDNNFEEKISQKITNTAVVEISESFFQKFTFGFDFIKKYFDINTSDFFKRVFLAFIPFNPYFYNAIEDKPDIWGPFWIYTTLIFITGACGSISHYLYNDEVVTKSYYQEIIPPACGYFYGVGFILPLILYFVMKCFGSKTDYMKILCTYGYSMIVYIPILIIISIIPGVSYKINNI